MNEIIYYDNDGFVFFINKSDELTCQLLSSFKGLGESIHTLEPIGEIYDINDGHVYEIYFEHNSKFITRLYERDFYEVVSSEYYQRSYLKSNIEKLKELL